ncbi:hypothetical protein AVEN_59325-1, partial [Araneus ventricosus]
KARGTAFELRPCDEITFYGEDLVMGHLRDQREIDEDEKGFQLTLFHRKMIMICKFYQ